MTDDNDPQALIEAAAWMIRSEGISYLEAKNQVQDIFRDAWEVAAMAEQMLADFNPPSDALH